MSTDGDRARCPTQHWTLHAWDVLFHVTLFATFFALFFYFRLRQAYYTSAQNIAEGFGNIVLALPAPLPDLVQRTKRAELEARAKASRSQRNRANTRAFFVSCLPIMALWLTLVASAVWLLRSGHSLYPIAANTLKIFVLFCVIELVIFSLVVSRFLPQSKSALLRTYTDAFADAIQADVCGTRIVESTTDACIQACIQSRAEARTRSMSPE